MRLFGRWPQTGLLSNPNVDLGTVEVPAGDQKANVLFWGGFGIFSGSENPEAAWRFLKFYVGEEGSEIWVQHAIIICMNAEFIHFGHLKTGMEDTLLLERIKNVFRKISSGAIRSGRNPFDVKLVAVTKTVPLERIKAGVDLGLRALAENRVQEAQGKIETCKVQCPNYEIEWHLVGHLQKNKVKIAVHLFDLIHSLDSIELAELLNKHAGQTGKIQRVLIEVKLSEEATKYGIGRENLTHGVNRDNNRHEEPKA